MVASCITPRLEPITAPAFVDAMRERSYGCVIVTAQTRANGGVIVFSNGWCGFGRIRRHHHHHAGERTLRWRTPEDAATTSTEAENFGVRRLFRRTPPYPGKTLTEHRRRPRGEKNPVVAARRGHQLFFLASPAVIVSLVTLEISHGKVPPRPLSSHQGFRRGREQ